MALSPQPLTASVLALLVLTAGQHASQPASALNVTFLGTGVPIPSPTRFGPSSLVRGANATILIDCGSGVTQRLAALGLTGAQVNALFLTHLHADHVVDIFQLLVTGWGARRDRPLPIYGPVGTRAFLEGQMHAWQPEFDHRIDYAGDARDALALDLNVTEFGNGSIGAFYGLEVTAIEVDHRPLVPAYGFLVQGEGQRVVFSGDTRPTAAITTAAKGADLLVHEVVIPAALPRWPSEAAERIAAWHTRSDEVGKIAHEAGVGCLALNHIAPPNADRGSLLLDVAADYGGPVVVAEDLWTVDVSRGWLTVAGGGVLALGRG
ncbi:unnamed protein product [Ostreobium quekettii]|uniref:Metallo-beta-lactamase domain-containing protein n=1 Tax=Ostreobium quekettii TaxID=121088 RepID=A0A8S1IRW6_9CHLO|nr:unnamed protein product [Ostreobium quekettii]